jgi:hypothetical protein
LYALPIYLKYGIAATFFTNTRDVIDNGQQAVDYAKLLILNGMEVASHFSRHYSLNGTGTIPPGPPMTESELRLTLQEAVDDITSWGGARNGMVESVVTPGQEWNNLAAQVIPEYHTSSSNGDPAHGGCPNGTMAYPPLDYMQCQSVVVEAGTSVADVKAIVQDCITNRKFVQLMFHYIEHDDGTKTQGSYQFNWLDSQLEELCAWCDQQRSANYRKIIFPQMRDAVRYMKGQRDYDYLAAARISIELGLIRVFPFIQIAFHVYNSAGEELLFSSVFSFGRSRTTGLRNSGA